MDMMALFYCAPFEEAEDFNSIWEKQTIEYVIKNERKMLEHIRCLLAEHRIYQNIEVEEVYSNLIHYLSQTSDYCIEKAQELSKNGSVFTVEGYVKILAKYVVKRYVAERYKRYKKIYYSNNTNDEDDEIDLISNIKDEKAHLIYDDIGYEIEEILKSYQYIRYRYGVDIFLLIYIRLLVSNDTLYKNILEVFGINKKKLKEIEEFIRHDDEILTILKAIAFIEEQKAIECIEKYIYGSKNLKENIKKLMNTT